MAERKRRTPSQKIKPGTPHPTKAHTVRGFDGRWVTRKSYNAAKKAKEVAKKGGSLVKRVTSAVTKSSKGDLLKIKKGDKGIVRAIKDTYKLGKDTRKSADAVYKAGKETRKVHDQLVKGGKEFVKGTREAGKATRRAYERLKPGGKIVKTKGSKITKYTKPASKIVRSPGGKVVKSPGGKVVKSPGGKMVKSPGGKLTTRAKVKAQKYTAPKTRIPTKGKVKVDGKTVYTKRDIKGDVKSKVKGAKSRVKQTVNKAKSGAKKTWATRPMGTVAKEFSKPGKFQKIKSLSRGLKASQNLKTLGIGIAANWTVDQAVDRTFRALAGKNKMSLKDFRAEQATKLEEAKKRVWGGKKKTKAKSTTTTTDKPKVTRNRRGRVVSTSTSKQNNKGLTFKNMKEAGLLDQPVSTPKSTPNTTTKVKKQNNNQPKPKITKPSNQVKNKVVKKKKDKEVSVGNMIGATLQIPKKKEAPKKKKYTMRDRMRAKNVAIHGEDAIKSVEKYNKGWQAARKAGTLKEFKKKNKAKRNWQIGRR